MKLGPLIGETSFGTLRRGFWTCYPDEKNIEALHVCKLKDILRVFAPDFDVSSVSVLDRVIKKIAIESKEIRN